MLLKDDVDPILSRIKHNMLISYNHEMNLVLGPINPLHHAHPQSLQKMKGQEGCWSGLLSD